MATSPTLHLCLLQTDITWEDPPANIELADKLIASAPPAHLYILPEMWATGFTMQPAEAVAKDQGQALDWMKTTAVKHNAAICGSLSVEDAGRFYNRFYCSFPEGRIASYDKKHLFTYSGEDLQYTPGTGKIVFELHGWRVRPIICYDLRFPAWCRNTAEAPYDVLLIVANWPVSRINHWDALLRARAIENQCYVVAVNRTGRDGNGLAYNGHSTVVDMSGNVILVEEEINAVVGATLKHDELVAYRKQFPFLQDRDMFEI